MIVYFARNSKNGKGYVGKTERTLEQRIKEHVRAAEKGAELLFSKAIRKYGIEAFEWRILQEVPGDDVSELDAVEVEMIELFETFAPEHPDKGYNLTRGGDGIRGYSHTPETRAKMSESRKGARNHNYGKDWGFKGTFSEESKRKMSEAAQGRKHSDETRRKISLGSARPKVAIPVHQLDTEGNVVATHQSVHQACQALDVWPYGIKACCEGRRQSYAGYGWKYARG